MAGHGEKAACLVGSSVQGSELTSLLELLVEAAMNALQIRGLPPVVLDVDNGGLPEHRPSLLLLFTVAEPGRVSRLGVDDLLLRLIRRLG